MRWYSWKWWRLAWGVGARKMTDLDGTRIRVPGFARLYWLEGKYDSMHKTWGLAC